MGTRKMINLKANEGSILILVLWILAFLVLLSLGLGYTTSLEQKLVSYQRDRLTALYLAKGGYFRALVELENDKTLRVDSYLDPWAHNVEAFQQVALGEGSFSVSYPLPGEDEPEGVVYGVTDEDRKININTASQAVLLRFPGMTDEIGDSLLEWRAKDRGLGEGLGEVKDRPFEVLEELLLVEGMTDEVFQALQPFITVYTDGKVNLNTAPREVLMALGMGEDLVNKLLRFRRGLDDTRGTEDDQSFSGLGGAEQQLNAFESLAPQEAAQMTNLIVRNRLKVISSVFRIRSSGTLRDGKIIRSVEGIVQRGTGQSSKFSLLSWHEY